MATMSPSTRKLALTTHVTTSVGWLGAVAAFLALAVAGVASLQAQTMQAAYLGMNLVCWAVVVPLSIASPLTGLVQALGTPWGLTRHYWVLVKLLVTIPCSLVLLLHMIPTSRLAAAAASGQLVGDAMHDLRVQLVADSAVALAVLVFTTVLSVYKPAGLTERGARHARASRGTSAPVHALPRWVVWLRRLAIAVGVCFLAAHIAGKGVGGHLEHLHQASGAMAAAGRA